LNCYFAIESKNCSISNTSVEKTERSDKQLLKFFFAEHKKVF
jgi:hypothetical protein